MTVDLLTDRLLLRQWRDDDREPFAALNADPAVMRHFPAPLTRSESDALIDRVAAGIAEHGWGFWAAEVRGTGEFAGLIGLGQMPAVLPCAPGVEIGWRLSPAQQGRGYATEGARRALSYAFDDLGLADVVASTTTRNLPSQRVMQRLGMTRDPAGDFEHPRYPAESPERHYILYRLSAPAAPLTGTAVIPVLQT